MAFQSVPAIFYQGNDQGRIDHTPGGAVVSGDVIDLSGGGATSLQGYIGIVTSPEGIGASELGSVATKGVFKMSKETGSIVFAVGAAVGWDESLNTDAGGAVAAGGAEDYIAGVCVEAAVAGDDNVKVEINVGISRNTVS